MPWTYHQPTGQLLDPEGRVLCCGYSGLGSGKNAPADEGCAGMGPIPQGNWLIGKPRDDERLGPMIMPLSPAAGTDALGRSGFYIHGDSAAHPGASSHGCVILPRSVRAQIALSGDRTLCVEA